MIIIFEDNLPLVENAIEIAGFLGIPSEKVLGFKSYDEFLSIAQTEHGGVSTLMSQVTHVFLDHDLIKGTPNGQEIYEQLADPSNGFNCQFYGIAGQPQPYLGDSWTIKDKFFEMDNWINVLKCIFSQKEGERITIK